MKWCQIDLELTQSQYCFTVYCLGCMSSVCVCVGGLVATSHFLLKGNILPAMTAPLKPRRLLIAMIWHYSDSYGVKDSLKFSTGRTYTQQSNQSKTGHPSLYWHVLVPLPNTFTPSF